MTISAVILCGGRGTRLQPVIGDLPKCLAPVAGRPFIHYLFDHLVEQKVTNCILCARGRDRAFLHKELQDEWKGMSLSYFHNNDGAMGTGGDLRALRHNDLLDDLILVLNGDTYCKYDLATLLADFQYHGREHYFALDVYGLKWTRVGVTIMEKSFLSFIPSNDHVQLEDCLKVYRAGVWRRYAYSLPFVDMGTPEGYAQAEDFLREQGAIS